jgi:hypothetical protein
MGANTSVQIADSLTATVNESLTNVSQSIHNNMGSNQQVSQDMSINLKNVRNCDVSATQKAAVMANVIMDNNTELANEMAAELMNKLEKQIETQVEQANEELNLGQMNTSVMETRAQTYIKNNLNTIINTSVQNSVEVSQDGTQKMSITISDFECPPGGGSMDFMQEMLMKNISKNISKNIVNNTVKHTITNDIKEEIKQSASQKNTGFGFGAAIVGIICLGLLWLMRQVGVNIWILLIIIILIVAVLLVYFFVVKPANDSADLDYLDDVDLIETKPM